MKQFYFSIIFLALSLFVKAQTSGSSTEVGITAGQLSVSLSGAANYNVPILVPKGINGVEPQISLKYNSQGGNGIAGYGWDISGVSGITRIAATKTHDGTINPVDFDAYDRFALDGQRLILKNGGTYGGDNVIYETENFSNIKVTSYGVHPNGANYGPQYFKVEYPDGSISYYGNSADSRSITTWAITTWENSNGVRINYQYISSNNSLNITSIKYGALSSGTPINEIQFSYTVRKRPEQSYIGGQSILINNLLTTIKVFTNGTGFRNYTLGYDETYREYQRLTTITEKSGDNSKSYNPTVFTYGSLVGSTILNLEPANLGLSNIDAQTTGNISGDFNGDGKTDIILYPLTTANAKKKYWLYNNIIASPDITNLGIEYNIGVAFEEIFPMTILEGNSSAGFKLQTKQGWITKQGGVFTTYAFDGYGIAQLDQKTYSFPRFIVDYQNECGGENPDKHTKSSKTATASGEGVISYHIDNEIPRSFISGDFNGDALTDIVVLERSFTYPWTSGCTTYERTYEGGSTLFLNFDKRLSTSFATESGHIAITNDERVLVADFNGDGKSDLFLFGIGKVSVYSLNENNQFILLFQSSGNDAGIVLNRTILMGDYNGDGKADFVIPTAIDQDNWNFYMSTGVNFKKINGSIGIKYNQSEIRHYDEIVNNNNNWTTSLNENTFVAGDFTGDGKTDILNQQNFTVEEDKSGNPVIKPKGTPQVTQYQIAMNLSFTESIAKFMATVKVYSSNVKRYPIPIFSNLDDTSKNFKYSLISGSSINGLDFVWYNKLDVLLNKVTTGNGVTETIFYKPLDVSSRQGQYSVYFNSSSIENYPNIDILSDPNFLVVSMLEKKSSTSYKKKIFQYNGAVSNVEGLGFLGFRSTVSTNWYDSDDAIISSISKNDIAQRGANIENYTVLGLHEPLTVLTNQIPRLIVKEGNYTITGSENLSATQSITLKPDTWIKPSNGNTFLAKIDEEANNSPNTPTNFITKSRLYYESELLPNKVFKIKNTITKNYNGLDNTGSETYVNYDAYNNPTQTTVQVKEGATTLQTTTGNFTYENQPNGSTYYIGRLTGKSQSVLGSGSTSINEEVYSYSNNLLSQVKRKGDGTTNYITEDVSYDSFGNIIKKTLKAGTDTRETNFVYEPTGRFLQKSIDIENLETSYIYNPNGTLKSKTNPFLHTTSYEYDSWFKKTKEIDYLGFETVFRYVNNIGFTVLTKTGSDGTIEEEIFDDLGRKTKTGIKNIMGQFSYISYLYDIHDRTYKVSEPYIGSSASQWNETKYDVYGRVYQSIAFTGKTTDINTPPGLITTVTDGTKSETYTKNAVGQIVSMYDSPSNTINYTYFPNGNISKINYGGIETKILQDGWGRKKEINDPSAGIFKYTYNDFGDLIKEESPNGITNYNLTSLGKLNTKTISGNTNSKTTYTYDSDTKLLIQSKYEDLTNLPNTIITDYKYDASKRISQKTETTPYAKFIKRYKYDLLGRVEFENSTAKISNKTSSTTIKNTYKNGVHYQVLDSVTNAVLWQTDLVNSRGQLLSAKSGPTTITNDYDSNGFASQFKFDKTTPASNILTLNTVFDGVKSNLNNRTNNLFAWNESFDYDKDRLTKFNNILGVQETQAYDDKGRITQNALGTYNYNFSGKPYQNSSVTLEAEATGYYTNREGIYNDSMEDSSGWDIYDPAVFSYDKTTPTHSGRTSLKISNSASTAEKVIHATKWIKIDNVVPTEYTYSVWVKSDGPQSEIFLFMKTENEQAYFTLVNSKTTNVINEWKEITGTFLVPANIKKLNIRLDNNGQGTVWFDDAKIRKTANPAVTQRDLIISYNTFKSPVQIEETGVDKVSFVYNDENQRSTMFYGGLDDKFQRPLWKHYSADGTMEIKENKTTGNFEFITYIDGDGYSAPAVFKSDGVNPGNYLYLQRDYQGSILAITDANGALVEKRLFDAWGGILKVQDGAGNVLAGLTVLDRGYTGHEHIQSVGIINMNGRLYDPKLRRFLQPDNNIQDPFNTQNYNRYGYVLNNPLKYTDQSGEFWNLVGFLFSAYVHGGAATGEANPFKWNIGTFINAFTGAGSGLASSYATKATNSYIDNYNKPALGVSAVSSGHDQYAQLYRSGETTETSKYNNQAFGYAGAMSVGLVADDVTGVGIADDVLIPVAWGTATSVWVWDNREVIRDDAREIVDAIHRSLDPQDFHYVTYTKTSLDGRLVYVGRSSGFGTPEDIVRRRDASHHIKGYGPAELSSSLPATIVGGYGARIDDPAYWAIRGSEQIQIDNWDKKGMSGNRINGISPTNQFINKYLKYGIRLLYF